MHEATAGNVDREDLSDMANEDKGFRSLISHNNFKDGDRVNNVFELLSRPYDYLVDVMPGTGE